MPYKNLEEFIVRLENSNELIRIKTPVSSHLEISEITDRVVKNINKALLFENTGTAFPLLINAYGSEKRMCMALGVNSLDDIGKEIERLFKNFTKSQLNFLDKIKLLSELKDIGKWMPQRTRKKGMCQEVVMDGVDLSKLPVLTCWPYDGGPFITLPSVHTIDPNNGIGNVGMYRMQVFDNKTTGMHWHLHKGSAAHFNAYKKSNKRMPVSVTLGGDPAYAYVASAPLPENVDEYILAGFLRQRKVKLVKCLTNDIYVPEDVDFVLEGYIDTTEDFKMEGPFGDHTGFYSLADLYPVFHVSCITHKKNAVYPATIVGIPPQEDAWMGKATERIFLTPIRLSVLPEVIDMLLPVEGVFHNIAIVKIKNAFEGHAFKVMNALWGAGQMMLNKIMIVVDETINIDNPWDLFKSIILQIDIGKDILLSKGPLDVLDHATEKTGFGGKIGIAFTQKEKNFSFINVDTDLILENLSDLKQKNPCISDYNEELISGSYGFLIMSINKESADNIFLLKQQILNNKNFESIKCVVFIEHLISPYDYKDVVWRSSNNIEPSRDCSVVENCERKMVLFVDATMKSKKTDGFKKDWPNIICSAPETIKLVDEKWATYGIGSFIESPSKKYAPLVYNSGAIVTEKP